MRGNSCVSTEHSLCRHTSKKCTSQLSRNAHLRSCWHSIRLRRRARYHQDVTNRFLIQAHADVNARPRCCVFLFFSASIPPHQRRKSFRKKEEYRIDRINRHTFSRLLPRSEGYTSVAIVDTSSLTASMLFWNATCSLSVNFNSTIFSTPAAPRITGTPT